jgi:hypothetical protein
MSDKFAFQKSFRNCSAVEGAKRLTFLVAQLVEQDGCAAFALQQDDCGSADGDPPE